MTPLISILGNSKIALDLHNELMEELAFPLNQEGLISNLESKLAYCAKFMTAIN